MSTNVCKTCPNCKYEYIKTDKTYNMICNAAKSTIANHVSIESNIDQPFWCPLVAKKENETSSFLTKYDILDNMKPFVKWDEIKVGDVYHIPPFGSNKRQDIIIVGVFSTYFTYRDKKPSNEYSYTDSIKYMYQTYNTYKLMRKKILY